MKNKYIADNERLKTLRHWFHIQQEARCEHIHTLYPNIATDGVEYRLLKALPSCKAMTPAQFRTWTMKQIHKLANPRLRKKRSDVKPFVHEIHADKAFIQVQDSQGNRLLWIVPVDWLTVAESLWPVHIKYNRTGPYLARKIRRQRHSGEWYQTSVAIHRLFLDCGPKSVVYTKDGNLLNFSGGNLSKVEDSDKTKHRYEDRRPIASDLQVNSLEGPDCNYPDDNYFAAI